MINIDSGQSCHTTRELLSPVASLAISLIIVITVFIVTTTKLQRDKVNMRRQIKSISVQSSGILKRDLNQIVDYENNQEIATKIDIEIKKNPAYSTVKY